MKMMDCVDLSKYNLPCYVEITNNFKSEQVYLYRPFRCKSFRAKCYNSELQDYLLSKRPSVLSLLNNNNSNDLANKQQIKPAFECIIPYDFKGLFEIFSSNSLQLGGILDHELNVISLSSRIKSHAKYYYVNKELTLYETVKFNSVTQHYKSLTSSINIFEKVNKKWSKFERGAILKAIKVDDVDYLLKKSSCYQLICCRFDPKTKFELAIEFKLVDNLNDLDATNFKKKSFYLPVDTLDNPDIDLIPIELNSHKHLNVNSLQLIRNFSKLNLNENLIDLKLFNARLDTELEKSILELNDFNENCDLVIGYNLTRKELFVTPARLKSSTIQIKLLTQADKIREFKQTKLTQFESDADKYLLDFNSRLHRLELFEFNLDLKKLLTLKKRKRKIIHFSDLASLGKSFSSDTLSDAAAHAASATTATSASCSAPKQRNQFKPNKYYSFKIRNNRKLSVHNKSTHRISKRSNSV